MHAQRGTTIVETALVMIALLVVLFGIMDFGRAMYTYHLVNNAARIGARFAIVHGGNCTHSVTGSADTWPCPATADEIANYVSRQSVLMGLGDLPTDAVQTSYEFVPSCNGGVNAAPNNQQGCAVTVTVSYEYDFLLPFMPTKLNISSNSRMLISQ